MSKCHCGSGKAYSACCEPIITGKQPAETAEQLMRARYSAYVGVKMDFILKTTHPDQRKSFDPESSKAWAENSEWESLQIVATEQGGKGDKTGQVEFIAKYREDGKNCEHHELATFDKIDDVWYFTDGHQVKNKPLTVNKIGRNEPCSCGSGQKYKKCCGK